MKKIFSRSTILALPLLVFLPYSTTTYAAGIVIDPVDEMVVTAYVSTISNFSFVGIGNVGGGWIGGGGAGGAARAAIIHKAQCSANLSNVKAASGTSDKGNYLCQDCTLRNFGAEELIFIKTTVNRNVNIWQPNDIVTITNGNNFTTFFYHASGNFLPKKIGSGIGPGKAMNHDGKGNACQ